MHRHQPSQCQHPKHLASGEIPRENRRALNILYPPPPATPSPCSTSVSSPSYSPSSSPTASAQVNRSQAVNLRRIREIRRTSDDAWELKLDPPVNLVLPISRRRVAGLWECFGE